MSTLIKTPQILHGASSLATVLDSKPSILASYTGTWDPPSLAAGAYTTANFTVAGAALGNIALCSLSVSTADCTLSAQVTAANTVTVTLHNLSAGTVNLSLSNLRIVLI